MWQPLIGGLLTVLAACIFAAAILRAARIRAGGAAPSMVSAYDPSPDLRLASSPLDNELPDQPTDFIRKLEQLRSLVRSALSALTSSDANATGFFAARHASCKRIMDMPLEESAFPQHAPKAAYELLDSLKQHIQALSLSEKAPASDISDILIKVNSSARDLARVLAQSAGIQPAVRPPASKRQ